MIMKYIILELSKELKNYAKLVFLVEKKMVL